MKVNLHIVCCIPKCSVNVSVISTCYFDKTVKNNTIPLTVPWHIPHNMTFSILRHFSGIYRLECTRAGWQTLKHHMMCSMTSYWKVIEKYQSILYTSITHYLAHFPITSFTNFSHCFIQFCWKYALNTYLYTRHLTSHAESHTYM